MKTFLKILCAFVLALAFAPDAGAQAYCALRDPLATIQEVAPDSSGHRSITELVGGAARGQVADRLPFTIHLNELGKHTLYVILKDGKPDGFLHVRSEKGKWGLVEIVWYFDLDLRVKDFRFQRCRDGSKVEIESKAFVAQLRNKGFDEIRQILSSDGLTLLDEKLEVSGDAAPLALSSVQSALKTIAVTEIVWKDHLAKIRQEASSETAAEPDTAAVQRTIKIDNIYSAEVMRVLTSIQQDEEWIVHRKSVKGTKAIDSKGNLLELIVQTRCTAFENIVTIRWRVDTQGQIIGVAAMNNWPDKDIEGSFTGLEGLSLQQLHKCSSAAQLAAAEVLAIAQIHLGS